MEFAEGRSISDRAVLSDVLTSVGADPAAALELAETVANKKRLKVENSHAKALGLPGAPCLVTADGEIF